MRLVSHTPIMLSVASLLACQGAGGPAVMTAPSNPLPLVRFSTDSTAFAEYSGVTAAQNLVVRDASAWNALWQRINAMSIPVPPLPAVDFTREMIVAAAMGTRNTGGYDILLTGATEDQAGVEIRVLEVSPGAACITTQALTQPVVLARAARRDGSVRFVVSRETRKCGP